MADIYPRSRFQNYIVPFSDVISDNFQFNSTYGRPFPLVYFFALNVPIRRQPTQVTAIAIDLGGFDIINSTRSFVTVQLAAFVNPNLVLPTEQTELKLLRQLPRRRSSEARRNPLRIFIQNRFANPGDAAQTTYLTIQNLPRRRHTLEVGTLLLVPLS